MSFFLPLRAVWFGQPVSLERPLGLWLAALVVVLSVLVVSRALRSAGATTSRWVAPGSEAVLVSSRWRQRRALRLALGGLGLSLLLVAWAKPTLGEARESITRRGIDLVIALDASRSMLASDVAPNRLTAARAAVEQLLGKLAGDRVGVVAFARDAFVQAPLTTDYDAARLYLRAVDPLQMQQGGTALAGALREARGLFERAEHGAQDRAVLVVSDGEDWEGGAAEEARALAGAGAHVYTLGVGTRAGAPVPIVDGQGRLTGYEKDAQGSPVLTRPDPEALGAIAAAGNGAAFFEDGAVDVAPVAATLERLQKGELGATTRVTGLDRYQWFALPGVLLLSLALGLRATKRRPLQARAGLAAAAAALVLLLGLDAHAGGLLDSPDPDVRTGLSAYEHKDFGAAAKAFEQAEARGTAKPVATFDRGVALFKAGKADEAIKAFEQAHTPALQGREVYNAGVAQASLQKKDEAIHSFRAALEADPSNEDARHNLEVLLETKKEDQKKQDQPKQDQSKQDQSKQDQSKPGDSKQQKNPAAPQQAESKPDEGKQKGQQPTGEPKQEGQAKPPEPAEQRQGEATKAAQQSVGTPRKAPARPATDAERTLDQLKQGERLLPLSPSHPSQELEPNEHPW
jgi:Ca-activated chloride channel family protein